MLLPHNTLGWMVYTRKGPCEDQGDTEQCARAEVDVRAKGVHLTTSPLCSMASAWGRGHSIAGKDEGMLEGGALLQRPTSTHDTHLLILMTMCGEGWMLLFSTAHLPYPREGAATLISSRQ